MLKRHEYEKNPADLSAYSKSKREIAKIAPFQVVNPICIAKEGNMSKRSLKPLIEF